MLTHKNIDKICYIILIFCVLLAVLFANAEALGVQQAINTNHYAYTFFGETAIQTIDIQVDEDQWQNLLDNASDKEYINVTLVINGEVFNNIAIRTKGNSSLQQVASSTSDRYSFKIEFDHYDSTKSYHGLDKLTLNNIIQDNTFMKDFLAYTLMGEFGVASPLVNYVDVSVNGESIGLYLGVEAIEEAFLQRNYGNNYGVVYKPESTGGMGGGDDRMQGGMPSGEEFEEISALIEAFMNGSQTDQEAEQLMKEVSELVGMDISGVGIDTFLQMASQMMQMDSNVMGGMPGGDMAQGGMQQGNMAGDMAQGGMQQGNMAGDMAQGGMQQGNMAGDMAQGGMQQGNMAGDMAQGGMQQGNMPTDMAQGGMQQGNMPTDMAQGDRQQGDKAGMQGGMQGSTSGSTIAYSLGYTGDDFDEYSYIFDNAAVNISDKDKQAVVDALYQLSLGENLESALDIEAVIRYFIVHNFVLNFDSYTGSIMHNYYLYEDDGKLSMLPWDYNLSYAAFMTNYSTSQLVNFPIDTPVGSGTVESRAMLAWIFADEEYTALYHELFAEFIADYFDSGYVVALIDEVDSVINSYVQADTTKFISYATYVDGVSALKEIVTLRAKSVSGQLDGSIPSTADGQSLMPATLVDTSHIEISKTGTTQVNIGGSSNNRQQGGQTQSNQQQGGQMPTDQQQGAQQQGGQMPADQQQGGQQQGGQMPSNQQQGAQQQGGQMPTDQQQGMQQQGGQEQSNRQPGMQQVGAQQQGGMQQVGQSNTSFTNSTQFQTLLVYSVVLLIAVVAMKIYKKP